jgi:hypothetical protein
MGYIELGSIRISTDPSNNASDAFGTRLTSGYILNFLFMVVVFVASTIYHAPISVIPIIMIYLIFRIKMNRNLALIPTDDPSLE